MRDGDTLPPCAEELELVAAFESHARMNENDARLARLAELVYAHTFSEGDDLAAE